MLIAVGMQSVSSPCTFFGNRGYLLGRWISLNEIAKGLPNDLFLSEHFTEKFSEANICQYFLQGEYVKLSDNQKKILYHVNPV